MAIQNGVYAYAGRACTEEELSTRVGRKPFGEMEACAALSAGAASAPASCGSEEAGSVMQMKTRGLKRCAV